MATCGWRYDLVMRRTWMARPLRESRVVGRLVALFRRSMAARGPDPPDARRRRERPAAAHRIKPRCASQLDRACRECRHSEIRGAHTVRMDPAKDGRLGIRLVRQLGRRSVGRTPVERDAGGALAAEKRRGHLRVRPPPGPFHRRWQVVDAVVRAPQRWNEDGTRFRIALRDARFRAGSRLARWQGNDERPRRAW